MTSNSAATVSTFLCTLLFISTAQADDDAFKYTNFGYGTDQGDLSVTGSLGRFNAFASNQGIAFDYIIVKQRIKKDWPVHVYIGGGIFGSRSNDFALRVPIGVEIVFAKNWNIYGQLIPNWQITSPQGGDLATGYGLRFQF